MRRSVSFHNMAERTSHHRFPWLAMAGVCAYLVGFVLPMPWDVPLIVLAASVLFTAVLGWHEASGHRSTIRTAVLIYLAATGLSVALSIDPGWSARLSRPILPGILIYFSIGESFQDLRALHVVSAVLSSVALALEVVLLASASAAGAGTPSKSILSAGIPILVVPNDVILLSIVAPFSLAQLLTARGRGRRSIALASILGAAAVATVYQSRGAALTLLFTLSCVGLLTRPRAGLLCSGAILVVLFVLDARTGFPLIAKFGVVRDTRFSLWAVAGAMFADAPWFGHGAHTYALLHQRYLSSVNLPDWVPLDPHASVPWPHNLFLETLAGQGIVGFAALVHLLARGLSQAWNSQRHTSGEAAVLGRATLAALSGLCLAGLFELTLLREWVVVVLFLLLGIVAQLSTARPRSGAA